MVLVLQKLLDKVFRSNIIKHAFADATLFENIFQMALWGAAAIFIGEAVFHVQTQNAVATLGIASLPAAATRVVATFGLNGMPAKANGRGVVLQRMSDGSVVKKMK